MANISAIKKIKHTVTATESGVVPVSVLWDSSFYDTNYAINVVLELVIGAVPNYILYSISSVTPQGFVANVAVGGSAGDKFVLHCSASHK